MPYFLHRKLGILKLLISGFLFPGQIQAQAPEIQWQHCIGGINADASNTIEITDDGGYIVAGTSSSVDGDILNNHGQEDYVVVKLDSLGKIQWQKSFGGSRSDIATDICVVKNGGFIVSGYTNSIDGDVSGKHGNDNTTDYWIVKLDDTGSIEWQRCFGGSDYDYAYSIQSINEGGYIAAGMSSSNDGNVTGDHGNGDCWIVKLSSSGNMEWQRSYGGINPDAGNAIRTTPDGGYIVAGFSFSADGDVTNNNRAGNVWILKLTGNGSIQWQKSIGGSRPDYGQDITLTKDGGYIVAGNANSQDGDVNGNHGSSDFLIVKLNSAGSIEWLRSFGGSGADDAQSVKETEDDGFVIAGYSTSADGDITGNRGGQDGWVIKLNSDGIMQWQKCLGGSKTELLGSVACTKDGGYVFTGTTASNDFDVAGNHSNNNDFWVVKLACIPQLPTIKIAVPSNHICTAALVTFTADITHGGTFPIYQWKKNGINVGSNISTYADATLADNDSIVCYLTSNSPCAKFPIVISDTIIMKVSNFMQPSITVSASTTIICAGTNINFTATPQNGGPNPVYEWSLNGNVIPGAIGNSYASALLKDNDTIICTLSNTQSSCAASAKDTVVMKADPAVSSSVSIAANKTAVCKGETVVFTALPVNGGSSPFYQWKINNVNQGENSNLFEALSLNNGDMVSCIISNGLTCAAPASSNSIIVNVDAIPMVHCMPDAVIISGTTIQLNAAVTANVKDFRWSPAGTLTNGTIVNPVATPLNTTTYALEATTAAGCKGSDQVKITVVDKLKIPNAFSPNGDNINDTWSIPALAAYYDCTVTVFDRYGNTVFNVTSYRKPWDGTQHGKPVPVGTYYYVISYKNADSITGSVTILR